MSTEGVNTHLTATPPSVEADGQTDRSTCEEDEVALLCVLSLEFDQTVQVGGLTRLGVTLVVGEELHQVLLLVGGEEVQEPHGVGVQSSEGQRGN